MKKSLSFSYNLPSIKKPDRTTPSLFIIDGCVSIYGIEISIFCGIVHWTSVDLQEFSSPIMVWRRFNIIFVKGLIFLNEYFMCHLRVYDILCPSVQVVYEFLADKFRQFIDCWNNFFSKKEYKFCFDHIVNFWLLLFKDL